MSGTEIRHVHGAEIRHILCHLFQEFRIVQGHVYGHSDFIHPPNAGLLLHEKSKMGTDEGGLRLPILVRVKRESSSSSASPRRSSRSTVTSNLLFVRGSSTASSVGPASKAYVNRDAVSLPL